MRLFGGIGGEHVLTVEVQISHQQQVQTPKRPTV